MHAQALPPCWSTSPPSGKASLRAVLSPTQQPSKECADRYVLFVEQNSQRISASRRVAALAFAAAASATSVLVIGGNPSFLLSTRCSGRIATSGRMLTPMPTDTAAWMLERLGLV